ncbi:MAG TPA: hypothetical protein VLX32_09295 [Candidatus Acidoferrum sp.]|nr:hypothetical protein [Candidatus Acidoferrum sp.]
MKNLKKLLIVGGLALGLAGAATADTLQMKDGRVFQGKYLGGTQAVLRFEINGDVQTFSTNDVLVITFTGSAPAPQAAAAPAPEAETAPPPAEAPPADASEAADAAPAPNSAPAPAPAPTSAPEASPAAPANVGADSDANSVTIPAGQSLLVRMIDGVDSTKNHVGDVFHASLETDLNVNDVLVARKGADVYGKLVTAEKSGTFSGHSELQLELTSIVIDGRTYPLVSSDYNVQGKGRGGDTAKKVGGGAVVGAIIGAIAGGGKGAAIGAAAGSATGAGVQVLTKGEQVKVPSETLLEFRLQQPATVIPAGG